MTEYIIDRASQSDASLLFEIEQMCFNDPWSLKSFENALSGNTITFFIARSKNNTPVGFVGIFVAADESEIVNVAVLPEFRRLGIANLLMQEAISHAYQKGCSAIYLEVRESNTAAQSLYQKFGFDVIGKRRNYYDDPREDAILMKKALS